MDLRCSLCQHTEKEAINKALLEGESFRSIAKRYGTSAATLVRHKKHLPVVMLKAQEAGEVAQADGLLAQVDELRTKAWSLLNAAEQVGDLRTALAGIREARSCLELLGKLAGELQDGNNVNIIMSPQWIEIRTVILKTLEPYPEALLALSSAWDEGENSR